MRTAAMPIGQAMLVVGHPGHELRVHGWLEAARPIVMVLTDGSGHTGQSRLASTTSLIDRAGASIGPVFGRLTDAALYRALLDQNIDLFIAISEELADTIARHQIRVVAGDDAEGYNPTHDLCRLLVNTSVHLARTARDISIANLGFGLTNRPDQAVPDNEGGISQVVLDQAALDRKLRAAETYAEMAAEVASAREAWGDEAFRVETFRHVPPGDTLMAGDEPPFYERHGATRVEAGLYPEVIRYDRHIRPVADALAARTKLQLQ